MGLSKKGFLKIAFFTLLFLGLMIAWVGFGERGFIHLYRMKKERQAHLERIRQLEAENRKLLEEIRRLAKDKAYIEKLARRELGLVKEGEVLYRFDRDKAHPEPREP